MSPNLILIIILIFFSSTYLCISAASSSFSPPFKYKNTASGNEIFIRNCSRSRRCSTGGPEIRFPFRLETDPSFCGLKGFELSCSGQNTVLHLPFSGDYYIRKIDYRKSMISMIDAKDTCRLRSLLSLNFTSSVFNITGPFVETYVVLNCTKNTTEENTYMFRPINCLSDVNNFVFFTYAGYYVDGLPSDCTNIRTFEYSYYNGTVINEFLEKGERWVMWNGDERCSTCEEKGKHCGFNPATNQTFCMDNIVNHGNYDNIVNHGSHTPLIIGTSMGGTITLLSIVLIIFYLHRKKLNQQETRLKVERFLANYKACNPTRYTFTDIKKITGHLKHKLGQGGFGRVYKGKLFNGVPVAVKLLEISSTGNTENFVNEVATIGRIHHFNVVRLLGFCSEGTRRALVYEFMPNGSLDKFILSKEAKTTVHRPFTCEKLQEIAIGIAHGIEYLHQGCDQRILHFDIKPHNILLDHNFHPKISDFGLAKLCSREQSIVSMTAVRGTIGYIAPELFSRNFGTVSYKSDVYSFGMLLLEIVGGRQNLDITAENHSQIYFPEWVFDQLMQGKEFGVAVEIEEEKIMKKLAIVAMWCIQLSPTDRPSMTEVVRMLEGDLESLKIPPKPFVSSSDS